ncbi:MAG: crosslink repair DNA glycosylase YcaQ family protein [bacterium]|nr:crosslink repair DNA glycosylase YcaQ family protein [bacterium]
MHHLSARDARRIAVRAQLLALPRPGSIGEVAERLAAIQVDLTTYVAPSAHLVLWSRLGGETSLDAIDAALESRELVEVHGFLRPAEDVALYTAEMAAWPRPGLEWKEAGARWVEANGHARAAILEQLRVEGPLGGKSLVADFAVDWRSSGWNSGKNVQMMLERLEEMGEVAVSHREGRERMWDLARRIFPADPPVPLAEALRTRAERLLRALGIARMRAAKTPGEPNDVGDVGEPARVEGLRGTWRVDRELLDAEFDGRTALLSPLDRLIVDRKRMDELFAFDYALEMYKPADQRLWGYYALPVLHGDRLVGKLDVQSDFRTQTLMVRQIHEDEPWAPAVREAVEGELRSLAGFLELELVAGR